MLKKWTNTPTNKMTNKDIKKEILNRLGLDPDSKADQAYYKKQYDLIRLRTVNYSTQQRLEEPLRPNEVWLRTLRYEQAELPLPAQLSAIKRTPSQNTKVYARRVASHNVRVESAGILNLEEQFRAMLDKTTISDFRGRYERFKKEGERIFINAVNKDGEIIATFNLSAGEPPPKELGEGVILTEPYTTKVDPDSVTITQTKAFLESLAQELHDWQDKRMVGNSALYGKPSRAKRKRVGS